MAVGQMNVVTLFDFDGVLVDSIEIFSDAVNVAGRKLNQPVAFGPQDLRNIKQMSIPEIVAAANVDPKLSTEFIHEIERELYRCFDKIQLFPQIDEAVRELREFGNLGIVSATSVAVLERVMANCGLLQFFDDIIGGDIPGTKAEKISALINKYGASASRTCMIGDTVSDIEQGSTAGVMTIAVSWGWHRIEWIRTAGPDFEAFAPRDLVDIVKHQLHDQ